MAEIKEQRSAFAAQDKGAVQEWLDHPCTAEAIGLIGEYKGRAERALLSFASTLNGRNDLQESEVASRTRGLGAILNGINEVNWVFEEAKRYANS